MLFDDIATISKILGIPSTVIPDLITLFVVGFLILLTLKGQLSWITLVSVYTLSMGLLTLLGIDSVFNVVTLISNLL